MASHIDRDPAPTVRLTIDGRDVDALLTATVLQAAASVDLWIPSFCVHEEMGGASPLLSVGMVHQGGVTRRGPAGERAPGCGLCVVEVEGRHGADAIVRACRTNINDGISIRTDSKTVHDLRRAAFARLLAEHPGGCLEGCVQQSSLSATSAGTPCRERETDCVLRRLSGLFGIDAGAPPTVRRERAVVSTAAVEFDWNLCVGCLRCVKACASAPGSQALGYVLDGAQARPGFLPEAPDPGSICPACGACAGVCPTGAITSTRG